MKLSRKWLNEFVDLPLSEYDDRAFDEAMTVSGSKVEVTEDLSSRMKNVKVGRILSLEKHPISDHMLVAQLDVGEAEPVQICTGAWNVHVGDLVPAALHNALLPNGTKITKGKLRGVPSNGMLCSLKELDVTEHDFPYASILPAAILGDYHPIDPAKPSISPDIMPGDKIFGSVSAAKITGLTKRNFTLWDCRLSLGETEAECVSDCCNLHVGDLVAFNTVHPHICSPEDLHAKPEEFPHCIHDGILILRELGVFGAVSFLIAAQSSSGSSSRTSSAGSGRKGLRFGVGAGFSAGFAAGLTGMNALLSDSPDGVCVRLPPSSRSGCGSSQGSGSSAAGAAG